jgi:hypothetical protein
MFLKKIISRIVEEPTLFQPRFLTHFMTQQFACLENTIDPVSFPLYEFVLFSASLLIFSFMEARRIETSRKI